MGRERVRNWGERGKRWREKWYFKKIEESEKVRQKEKEIRRKSGKMRLFSLTPARNPPARQNTVLRTELTHIFTSFDEGKITERGNIFPRKNPPSSFSLLSFPSLIPYSSLSLHLLHSLTFWKKKLFSIILKQLQKNCFYHSFLPIENFQKQIIILRRDRKKIFFTRKKLFDTILVTRDGNFSSFFFFLFPDW